jgi:Leucine-rich repeat (LRR) protein
MKRAFIMFVLICFYLVNALSCYGQQKFSMEQLHDPKQYGPVIAALLNTKEVYEYSKDTSKNCLLITNGFRTSALTNIADWLAIADSVEAYRIDIVYSKYPLRDGMYSEIYPLLLNRLIHLFEADPALNDSKIEYNKVLQTHCENDVQVDKLFHGIVIWYRTEAEAEQPQAPIVPDTAKTVKPQQDEISDDQGSMRTFDQDVINISNSAIIPDSVKEYIATLSFEARSKHLISYLEQAIRDSPDVDVRNASEEELIKYKAQLDEFMKFNPEHDSTVFSVFSRHKEWNNVLVVNDWTGSMYGYGAQVLYWHLLNLETSGITSLTLFNDGDHKTSAQKKIGETGGIYSENANNAPDLIKLFNLVMLKGGGGEQEENDIEAILKALQEYPEHSQVVLIADNNSCVRDIELADRIHEPVKIIICGYTQKRGVNPDYVYLAKVTGGGLYTIEQDIENIEATLGNAGEVRDLKDKRFRVFGRKCTGYGDFLKYGDKTFTDYKLANRKRNKVRRLVLFDNDLTEIPRGVYKMKKLNYLDLGSNKLSAISPKIANLRYLRELDVTRNEITAFPAEFAEVDYVEVIDISYNKFTALGSETMNKWQLRSLNASHNDISRIATEMNCVNLEFLDLSFNQLDKLPAALGRLRRLKILRISDNQISVIPDKFTGMRSLEELDASNNKLTALPLAIGKLRKLKVLNLSGNNFPEEEKERIRKALPGVKIIF